MVDLVQAKRVQKLLLLSLILSCIFLVEVDAGEGTETCTVAGDETCIDGNGNGRLRRAPPQILTNGSFRAIDPSAFKPVENISPDNLDSSGSISSSSSSSDMPVPTIASIPEGERISLHYVQDFLHPDTVSKLIRMCNQRSGWTNSPQSVGGTAKVKATRTSSSCPLIWPQLYLPLLNDPSKASKLAPVKDEIELTWQLTQRVASFLNIGEEHVEPFQIVRYQPGQMYREHHDHGSYYGASTEQRPWTLLLFMSDVPSSEGGYTKFRALNEDGGGVAVVPRMGDGVLWRNEDETTGKLLMDAVHEAVPPVDGGSVIKYAMNVWIAKDKIRENMDVSAYRTK